MLLESEEYTETEPSDKALPNTETVSIPKVSCFNTLFNPLNKDAYYENMHTVISPRTTISNSFREIPKLLKRESLIFCFHTNYTYG